MTLRIFDRDAQPFDLAVGYLFELGFPTLSGLRDE